MRSQVQCQWCALEGGEADQAWLVVDKDAGRLLVPSRHVSVLTELPAPEMAAFLAAVSAETRKLKARTAGTQVEIEAVGHAGSAEHFRVMLRTTSKPALTLDDGAADFASMAGAIAN